MTTAPESVLERNPVLADIVRRRTTVDENGKPVDVHSEISAHFAEALYRTVLSLKPELVVEVGMAMGVSSLAMLTAMRDLQKGSLISIDPFQRTDWKGTGVASVERAGLGSRHRLIEKPNYLALPELLAADTRIDFAYIDGNHTFEHVLLDFFYVDKMLRVDGVVGFNDCGWPSVHKFLLFLAAHRRYDEISVGLHATRAWESRRKRLARLVGLSGLSERQRNLRPVAEDRYFRKTEAWDPPTTYFEEF